MVHRASTRWPRGWAGSCSRRSPRTSRSASQARSSSPSCSRPASGGAAFATNDNIAWRSKLEKKPTDYLYPPEGVPREPGAVGLVKGSPSPNAAFLFHEYWIGAEAQKLLVEGWQVFEPHRCRAPTGSLPLDKIKLLTLDYAEYKQNRQDILQKVSDVFGGEWGI